MPFIVKTVQSNKQHETHLYSLLTISYVMHFYRFTRFCVRSNPANLMPYILYKNNDIRITQVSGGGEFGRKHCNSVDNKTISEFVKCAPN